MEAPIRSAAEQAAAAVYDAVRQAAYDAARQGAAQALREVTGLPVTPEDIVLDDRITRTEAARRLGVTPQTLIRLEKKGALRSERTPDGRVYVRPADVRAALAAGRTVSARARISRSGE